MNSDMPEVLSLIRFSTQEQTAAGKAGVEGQRKVNQDAAQFHGIRIRKEYVVVDVSGRHVAHDPQFQQIFRELGDPTLAGLLVPEQSRIVRPENFDDWAVLAHFQKNRKCIFTPTGKIDPNTPEGRMTLTMGAMMSSEELHNLKSRFARGKMIARLERRHPGGSLPRGFKFVRERNENGKVTGWHWKQDAVEMVRTQNAFELLFAGEPYELIAKKLGGTGFGWKRAMQNPIWIGIRRYPWKSGDEYDPEPTAKNPQPKKRRHLLRRETPLDVPTREELKAGALPIVRPIMSVETWDAAQEIIAKREGVVRKTRAKNLDKPRFLAMGSILYCACGALMYFRYGSNGRSHLDRYFCSSQYPHGPGCGAPSIRRNELDPAIEQMISKRMLNVKFMTKILESATAQKPAPDPVRLAIDKARADLEAGRKELLEMVRHHEITRKEFQEQIGLLETELRQHEALLPTAPPKFNAREFLQGIANTFAIFSRLPFLQKREILKGAVKRIVTDTRARTLVSITLSGGYMGRVNGSLVLKTQLTIRPVPDLVIQLPEPFEIPDTYVDRRAGNGQHPNQIANRFRGRIQ